MPPPHNWLPSEHDLIRVRRPHTSWDDIAREIGLARWTVIDYVRRVGLWTEDAKPVPRAAEWERSWEPPEPLRPGHPVSWGVISKGADYANL
jgi:hypothetical protein